MANLLNPQNHLFQLARLGQRLPHLILAIILTVVFIVVAQIGGGIIAVFLILLLSLLQGENLSFEDPNALMQQVAPDTALEQMILLILGFGPIFLVVWLWLALYEKRPFWTLGLERSGAIRKYLRGLLVGLLMFVAAVGISAAFGYIALEGDNGDPGQEGLAALGGVLLVFIGWMVQGAAEELLTRGWLLPVIGARYKPVLGVIISASIFALLHLINPNVSLIAVLNLALFGVFTALYALYERGLWGVFSLHSVWNWVQGNLFGFEVSGGQAPGGTLFDFMETGPDVITGGAFGPEGGLSVTAVLLAGCLIIWSLSRRRTDLAPSAAPDI